MTIKTCHTCGEDHLSEDQKTAALATELNYTEELCEKLGCRVKELEQAISAFCTGSVKVDVLRKLVRAQAY